MDICINELSLTGQYTSEDECIEKGLFPIIELLRQMEQDSCSLYKTYSLYNSVATVSGTTLHDILVGKLTRQRDEIRRLKLLFSRLFSNPYWEDSPKHKAKDTYSFCKKIMTGTSLAEACERDRMLLSFYHKDFLNSSIEIVKNTSTVIILHNFFDSKGYIFDLWKQKIISFEEYTKHLYRNSKINFDLIDRNHGFELISEQDESLFADAFRIFAELTWADIYNSEGLDYKEYTNKQKDSFAIFRSKKIFKFRITQKYRCFGEVVNGVFHVLMFDLTHKLSD